MTALTAILLALVAGLFAVSLVVGPADAGAGQSLAALIRDDGTPLTLAELRSALSSRLQDRTDARLELLPADDVALQRLLLVLDETATAGLPVLRLR